MKIKISTGYSIIELGYDLPRIPVIGERMVLFMGEKKIWGNVEGVLWDLDNMEVTINIH